MIFYNINEKFTIKIRSDIFEKNSGNSGFVRAWKMFLDSGNSGDLGDGRAGCTAANSSTQQPDRLSFLFL